MLFIFLRRAASHGSVSRTTDCRVKFISNGGACSVECYANNMRKDIFHYYEFPRGKLEIYLRTGLVCAREREREDTPKHTSKHLICIHSGKGQTASVMIMFKQIFSRAFYPASRDRCSSAGASRSDVPSLFPLSRFPLMRPRARSDIVLGIIKFFILYSRARAYPDRLS